ncbi:hypothetical protein FE257_001022 [Aspergillus nanangensis]|uniref:Uncharacterized protein n=1 Tax=Aspergillus nanangensis TaxID=2582783 RepID=A0AAD4CTW3_ASPNN|nr:hypothetical protein FE257_001022 [Aspergillus nanangensis]
MATHQNCVKMWLTVLVGRDGTELEQLKRGFKNLQLEEDAVYSMFYAEPPLVGASNLLIEVAMPVYAANPHTSCRKLGLKEIERRISVHGGIIV